MVQIMDEEIKQKSPDSRTFDHLGAISNLQDLELAGNMLMASDLHRACTKEDSKTYQGCL